MYQYLGFKVPSCSLEFGRLKNEKEIHLTELPVFGFLQIAVIYYRSIFHHIISDQQYHIDTFKSEYHTVVTLAIILSSLC